MESWLDVSRYGSGLNRSSSDKNRNVGSSVGSGLLLARQSNWDKARGVNRFSMLYGFSRARSCGNFAGARLNTHDFLPSYHRSHYHRSQLKSKATPNPHGTSRHIIQQATTRYYITFIHRNSDADS